MKKFFSPLFFCTLAFQCFVFAKELNSVEMSLGLPVKNRKSILEKLGPQSLFELKKVALNQKKDLNTRWRAIVSLGMFYPQISPPFLIQLTQSKKWFLRNAALIALSYGDEKLLIPVCKKLLSDASLIVRTSTVQIIEKRKLSELKKLLWKKLYAKENYRKSQSLWIREYIVRALSEMSESHEKLKFLNVLKDRDEKLWPLALKALNKNHKKELFLTPGQEIKNLTLREEKNIWLKWGEFQLKSLKL